MQPKKIAVVCAVILTVCIVDIALWFKYTKTKLPFQNNQNGERNKPWFDALFLIACIAGVLSVITIGNLFFAHNRD